MEQYIPKSALVAEIEKLVDKGKYHEEFDCAYRDGNNGALYALKDKLDTIEVKEVDLEKEIDNYIYINNGRQRMALELDWKQCKITFNSGKLIDFAKHFFELGLKAQKREEV